MFDIGQTVAFGQDYCPILNNGNRDSRDALFLLLASGAATDRVCLEKCTAMVELRGELDSDGRASAETVIAGLQAAFKDKGTRGVVLKIDSPGGSPVQAGEINDEIRRLRATHPDTPIYAVVEEICASGAYYVAVATDRIYVDHGLTGTNRERPGLREALAACRAGDPGGDQTRPSRQISA